MAEYTDREHFIPLRFRELAAVLADDPGLAPGERQQFGDFCRLIEAVFHYEYQGRLDALKDDYAPFDPDAETRPLTVLSEAERGERLEQLFHDFVALMERANFQRLERSAIESAVKGGASRWGINMEVDFDVFERLEIFACGDALGHRSQRRRLQFWRVDEYEVPIYQRLVLVMKLRHHKRLGPDINTSGVYLKLFKDIPKLDLEMLLPGGRVDMPVLQRLKLGSSLLGSVAFIGYKVLSELGDLVLAVVQRNPAAFWGPLSLVFGYGYRQYAGYQTTKQAYSYMLTQSLYYQNLDNNAGVITRLLDEAEEQECREAVLAYHGLWRSAPAQGWRAAELDDFLEEDLEHRSGLKVDFEVDDALAKLERLGLALQQAGRWKALPIGRALEKLDYAWDHYFEFNHQTKLSA